MHSKNIIAIARIFVPLKKPEPNPTASELGEASVVGHLGPWRPCWQSDQVDEEIVVTEASIESDNRHAERADPCLLLGDKRKWPDPTATSEFDPNRT